MYRIIFSILVSVFFFQSFTLAQCEECNKRSVTQYDIKVDVTPPVSSQDSVARFINMLSLTEHLAAYFYSNDPNIGCINYNYFSPLVVVDSSNYNYKAAGQLVPASNTAAQDYYIWGSIFGSNGSYIMEVTLSVGSTQETIVVGTAAFGDVFDPASVAADAGADLLSLWVRIMDFEKDKRDSGEPYAITPTIKLEPAKFKIDFYETVSVKILATDCDGEPLKSRQFILSAEGGTLDNSQVTTDDQGEASVMFTAGATPTIAIVKTQFSYTAATEKEYSCSIEPAVLQIQKPNDAWFIKGKLSFVMNEKSKEDGSIPGAICNIQEGRNYTMRNVFFAAWIKREAVSQDTMIFVQTIDPPISIRYAAYETEISKGYTSLISSTSYIFSQSFVNLFTENIISTSLYLNIAIGDGTYGFGIFDIDAMRFGNQIDIYDSFDPIDGKIHEEYTSDLGGDTQLSASVSDVSRDTSYNIVENDPLTGTTTTQTVTQSFFWNNENCILNYSNGYLMEQHFNYGGLFQIDNSSLTDITFNFVMSYSGNVTDVQDPVVETIPEKFNLYQNYPNPFNPSTKISWQSPLSGWQSIKLYDALGREVDTIVEGFFNAGTHSKMYIINSSLPSGVYFYKLQASGYSETKKMMLMK